MKTQFVFRKESIRILTSIICVVISFAALAQNTSLPVGVMEGAMDVTPSGALAYSVKIKMPPIKIPLQSDLSTV